MADRKPLKLLPDGGGDSTGLGEFVAGDTLGVVDGGTGLATVATSNILTGNGTSALSAESNLTFDGNHLTLADGDLVIGTAGHGIDFSATSDGSGTDTSELLDDYEEGTWTPVWKYGTTTVAQSGDQAAWYTKIGRLVVAHFRVVVNSTSGASGGLAIHGLPYTIANTSNQFLGMGCFSHLIEFGDGICLDGQVNATSINIMKMASSKTTDIASIQSGAVAQYAQIRGAFVYTV